MKRIAILTGLALAMLPPSAAQAAFPGDNGAIVYGRESNEYDFDGKDATRVERGIYVRTGWHERRVYGCEEIARHPGPSSCERQTYSDPAVSPDGSSIAFDAGTSLAVVGFDGTGFRLLPARSTDDGQPAFSPRGAQVVFTAHGSGLWIQDLNDEMSSRRLVGDASSPAWSARDWIAFVRDGAIYRVRPDGSRLRRLTREGAAPAWSPDGRRLFVYAYELFIVDLSGRMRHDFGDGEHYGPDNVFETHGIDWRPLPR